MTPQLVIGTEGRLGTIALNRPEAINALSAGMIAGITAQLEAWREDAGIRAVLFEGMGPRGFCAGGDVRAVRKDLAEGRVVEAQAFFADEYRMNGLIAGYEKPVISVTTGIVMGGGIGIAGHADFRFSGTDVRYAMPEAAIGFVSDVGVNAILARAPLNRALLFLMTGMSVGAADALKLGLTDCILAPEMLGQVRQGLVAATDAADVETSIVSLMQSVSIEPGEAPLCADADTLDEAFGHTDAQSMLVAIAEAEEDSDAPGSYSALLASRCPTSLEAIVQSHRAARQAQNLEAVLAIDGRLAALMSLRPDFSEGVRAVLVDKDSKPRWEPADFASVPLAAIASAIAGNALNADA